MLVLTRLEGEKICIGDKIIVEITHNNSDRVRLGIEAPPDKAVLRAELKTEKTVQETDLPFPNVTRRVALVFPVRE